jgi:serine/threonine protein phosphatase 1
MCPAANLRRNTPDDTRVYAIGDIHGCVDLLMRLHEIIREDAVCARERRKVVVYLGDYVDRGPSSAGVIELLMDNPLAGFETVFLKGNHEDFMLRFIENPEVGSLWLMNGGGATLASYGVTESANPDRMGERQSEFVKRVPAAHRAFLERLALTHQEGDYIFVHAGIQPGLPLSEQKEEDLLWIREPFLSSAEKHGGVVVHGHTPVESPEVLPNRINVDTGAVWSGRLTALVAYGEERKFLRT